MYPLLETIKCKNGKLFNLEFHQERFDLARKNYFGVKDKILLKDYLTVPQNYSTGIFKCRLTYSKTIEKIEFISHQYREINRLKLVVDNSINYSFKYSNREKLNNLFELRENCDDIIIVKNEFITDSSSSNLVFWDGNNWWTPQEPLLAGTQRARLLAEGKIFECNILLHDISKYKTVGLINAMNSLNEMPLIPIQNIF
jgi:4-amino-4-deoxychorismate lyase